MNRADIRRLVEMTMAQALEFMRRNPLGCYGAAKYIRMDRPTKYAGECKRCKFHDPCWAIDQDPMRCVVILEET